MPHLPRRIAAIALFGLSSTLSVVSAQALSPPVAEGGYASRLDRVRDTGILVLAYRENAVPFSYLHDGQPMGLGVEIAKAVAADMQRSLGLSQLTIRWNAVTLSTRIPLMTTNTVDLECATTTHTSSRARQVGFSHTFYVSETGTASKTQQSAIGSTRRVAAVEGTSTATRLLAAGQEVQLVRTNRNGMLALAQGKADHFVAAMSLLASERMQLGPEGQAIVLQTADLGVPEAFACMLPLGDPAFAAQVNSTLERLMRSGELARMHDRWFSQPIAPMQRALNLPLNAATRAAYSQPGSLPFE